MTVQEELEFRVRHYEAKFPDEASPIHYLVGRTAEQLLEAFKLAKGKRLTSEHFALKKRQQKKLEKQLREEEASYQDAA
jgi:hypothetical protein